LGRANCNRGVLPLYKNPCFLPNQLLTQILVRVLLSETLTKTKIKSWEFVGRKKKKLDAIDSVFDPLREFSKDSVRLVKRCHKPDRKEFTKVAVRTAIGFVVMGFVGFFVKLIFIPINNIIVGSG
ncbi:protein transport protein Sec61 subunit gamma-like, partial [Prunus dulcis]|uniref:protein transport protein Sec61 subunit gamma-like n=1 Tax=Prunus dulcis TaxID=3755 RepID=UPI00148228DD